MVTLELELFSRKVYSLHVFTLSAWPCQISQFLFKGTHQAWRNNSRLVRSCLHFGLSLVSEVILGTTQVTVNMFNIKLNIFKNWGLTWLVFTQCEAGNFSQMRLWTLWCLFFFSLFSWHKVTNNDTWYCLLVQEIMVTFFEIPDFLIKETHCYTGFVKRFNVCIYPCCIFS